MATEPTSLPLKSFQNWDDVGTGSKAPAPRLGIETPQFEWVAEDEDRMYKSGKALELKTPLKIFSRVKPVADSSQLQHNNHW